MPRFHVTFTEERAITVEVVAKDGDEALEFVASGEGTTLVNESIDNQNWDYNTWEVRQVDETN